MFCADGALWDYLQDFLWYPHYFRRSFSTCLALFGMLFVGYRITLRQGKNERKHPDEPHTAKKKYQKEVQ